MACQEDCGNNRLVFLFDIMSPRNADAVLTSTASNTAINVIRPATSILSHLLSPSSSSDPRFLTHIYHEISLEATFLENIVKRLLSDDLELAGISLNFVTALLRGATGLGDLSFGEEVERLGGWKALEVNDLSLTPG